MYDLWFNKFVRTESLNSDSIAEDSILKQNFCPANTVNPNSEKKLPCFITKEENDIGFLNQFLHSPSHFNQKVAAIGSFKNGSTNFQIQAIKDILESGGCLPIYISSHSASYEIFKSVTQIMPSVQMVLIDNSINHLDELIQLETDLLQKHLFSAIAIQKHLCNIELFQIWDEYALNFQRLGELSKNIHEAEVPLRDAHFVEFNLNAIRYADIPKISPDNAPLCGLNLEQACQIMRYIGMNPDLKILNISGVDFSLNIDERYYDVISTLLWYLMDGFELRKQSDKINKEDKKEFIVNMDNIENPLCFYKSMHTERWWISIRKDKDEKIISCSAEDYFQASQNQLSDRVVKVLDMAS